MPKFHDSILNQNLIAFAAGDPRAGAALYLMMRAVILAVARKRAPDLRNDVEDVASEVFIGIMEAPHRFDSARGSARAFIASVLVPEAIQRVRAKTARPGVTTRRRTCKNVESIIGVSVPTEPIPDADAIPSVGYGSPQAMEAACDAHEIWERATQPMKLILGGLIEGKKQIEIAAEVGISRFRVIRMIAELQRQVAVAA